MLPASRIESAYLGFDLLNGASIQVGPRHPDQPWARVGRAAGARVDPDPVGSLAAAPTFNADPFQNVVSPGGLPPGHILLTRVPWIPNVSAAMSAANAGKALHSRFDPNAVGAVHPSGFGSTVEHHPADHRKARKGRRIIRHGFADEFGEPVVLDQLHFAPAAPADPYAAVVTVMYGLSGAQHQGAEVQQKVPLGRILREIFPNRGKNFFRQQKDSVIVLAWLK